MNMRYIGYLALPLALAGAGCSKPQNAGDQSGAAADTTVVRLHWLGKDAIGADTNSAGLMRFWRQIETAKLEAQTLDKLAVFLAKEQGAGDGGQRTQDREQKTQESRKESVANAEAVATNQPPPSTNRHPSSVSAPPSSVIQHPATMSSPIRLLLDDLVLNESYLEVRQRSTGQPAEAVLAIRLGPERAALWQTNFTLLVQALTNVVAPGSSSIQLTASPTVRRAGDWTLISLCETNGASLCSDLVTRIQSRPGGAPFPPRGTNFWVQADLQLLWVARALEGNRPADKPAGGGDVSNSADLPRVTLNVFGDGENVRTRGELIFAKPLAIPMPPWLVPTNMMSRRLFSLEAVRGIAPLVGKVLAALADVSSPSTNAPSAQSIQAPPQDLPQQAFFWDDAGAPFHSYFALPTAHAADLFSWLAPRLLGMNRRIDRFCGYMYMEPTNTTLLEWSMRHAAPFLQVVTNSGQPFLYGGFAPRMYTRANEVPEFVTHLDEGTNLVFYEWEDTGKRLLHWRYLDDVYRMAFDIHGTRLTGTESLAWIANNITNLTSAVTELRMAAPNRLTFARKSDIGLNSLEIEYAANWLESPLFPSGLASVMVTNAAPRKLPEGLQRLMDKRPSH